ncbi:MAG: hypothetical protein ACXQS8_03560 [Candidatus Helarchaeales archaeon]
MRKKTEEMITITPENDFLTPVIKLKGLPDTDEISIISKKIGESMAIFSFHGRSADNYIKILLDFRGREQQTVADITSKEIFKHIFDPRSKNSYNVTAAPNKYEKENEASPGPLLGHDTNQRARENNINVAKQISKLKKSLTILAAIYPFDEQSGSNKWDEGYLLMEMKVFPAPAEKRDQALIPLLQTKNLSYYFEMRHLFGVIGISCLSHSSPDNNDPVTWSDEELEENKDKPLWICHLILMDARVLSEYKDSPVRAQAILSAIDDHQKLIQARLGFNEKKYKFKLIC